MSTASARGLLRLRGLPMTRTVVLDSEYHVSESCQGLDCHPGDGPPLLGLPALAERRDDLEPVAEPRVPADARMRREAPAVVDLHATAAGRVVPFDRQRERVAP